MPHLPGGHVNCNEWSRFIRGSSRGCRLRKVRRPALLFPQRPLPDAGPFIGNSSRPGKMKMARHLHLRLPMRPVPGLCTALRAREVQRGALRTWGKLAVSVPRRALPVRTLLKRVLCVPARVPGGRVGTRSREGLSSGATCVAKFPDYGSLAVELYARRWGAPGPIGPGESPTHPTS
jgi:hypothetical protein